MTNIHRGIAALLCALFIAVAPTALANERGANATTVRPEVGRPLQAALNLLKDRKAKAALEKISEADAIKDKTPFESYMILRLRAQAESAAGDRAAAARDFEATATAAAAPVAERLQFLAIAAGQYYAAKEYAKAAEVAGSYFKAGGREPAVRTIYVQALYLSNDFPRAAKELLADVEAEEQAGKAPSEQDLQIVANCYLKMNDQSGYSATLMALVKYHPKQAYWADLLARIQRKPGFSDRLTLDVFRLMLATGTLKEQSDFMEMAQLSLQAGLPAEAKKVVDEGYAKGVLGKGKEAERQNRLRTLANKLAATDPKSFVESEKEASASKDGDALVALGYAYVTNSRFEKGLSLMEQGIAKGGLKHPEDAKLHLGIAYLQAGNLAKAQRILRSVKGSDGTAELAQLWMIQGSRVDGT